MQENRIFQRLSLSTNQNRMRRRGVAICDLRIRSTLLNKNWSLTNILRFIKYFLWQSISFSKLLQSDVIIIYLSCIWTQPVFCEFISTVAEYFQSFIVVILSILE